MARLLVDNGPLDLTNGFPFPDESPSHAFPPGFDVVQGQRIVAPLPGGGTGIYDGPIFVELDGSFRADSTLVQYTHSSATLSFVLQFPSGTTVGDYFAVSGAQRRQYLLRFDDQITGASSHDVLYGDAGDDVLEGREGNDWLFGGTGDDVLYGGDGNDFLDGGTGADRMEGGAGNDTYVVDQNGDIVIETAGQGTDTVISSISFVLDATLENLVLSGAGSLNGVGNGLDNSIRGNSASNVLAGGGGNDYLDGGLAADVMQGGAGDDAYVVDNISDAVVEEAGAGLDTVHSSVSYVLAENAENLVLTGSGAISGTGNSLANSITGNGAANLLDGGAGADSLAGGFGNDIYVVDRDDTVREFEFGGIDTVRASFSYTLGSNLENLVLTGTADIDGTGNGLANVLTGNSGNNVLDGSALGDFMVGGGGNDTYFVDSTDDRILENVNEGVDTVRSSASHVMDANVEKLLLIGNASINGTGNALANLIEGNSGDNVLDGGGGADALAGGSGNDTYVVDSAGDVVTENPGEGTDGIQSHVTYTLPEDVENLALIGNSSIDGVGNELDNILTGNDEDFDLAGRNTLTGGAGDDVLDGRSGTDTLIGGTGNDTYVIDDSMGGRTSLRLEREPGHTILLKTYSFNTETGTLTPVIRKNQSGQVDYLGFRYDDVGWPFSEHWFTVEFSTGHLGTNMVPGTYLDAQRAAFAGPGHPGLDLYGDGSGSNQVFGSFTIDVADFDYSGSSPVLLSFSATFEYHSEGPQAPAVFGTLNYNYAPAGRPVHDAVVENADEGIDRVQSGLVDYTLPANVENLTLTGPGNLNGTGNALDNRITGNSGRNVLDGGAGFDILEGSTGDDVYVDPESDLIVENPDEGSDEVTSVASYALPPNIEILTLAGTDGTTGSGNELNNLITGNLAGNLLEGHAGADALVGGAGNDVLDGGSGVDIMRGGAGDDTFVVGDSMLVGGPTSLVVTSEPGDFIGAGKIYDFNAQTSTLTSFVLDTNHDGKVDDVYLLFRDNASSSTSSVRIQKGRAGQDGSNIEPGVYFDVGQPHYGLAGETAFVVYIDGRNSPLLFGSYTINVADFDYSGSNPAIRNLSITFEQRAGSETAPALFGTLNFSSAPHGTLIPDAVIENPGEGVDTVLSSLTYVLPANVEILTLTGADNVDGTGNALDNVLTGNIGVNVLTGGDGDDTLTGGDGDDTLTGGSGNDTLLGGTGFDTLVYGGLRSQYTVVTQANGSWLVTDLRGGAPDGYDTARDFELLQFQDMTIAPNHTPLVWAANRSLSTGQSLPASSLFSVTDGENDPIVAYSFADAGMGANTGYFTLDGVRQAENFRIDVAGDQLNRVQWVAGAAAGTDIVWARASDAGGPGEWVSFNLTTLPNLRPVVSAPNRTFTTGQTIASSTLFSAIDSEGNALVTYSFADAGMGANTGYFTLDGVRQAENFRIDVTGAQLDRLQWVAGAVSGNDTVWARASDAGGPGEWVSFALTTQTPPPNLRPVVSAQNRTFTSGQTVAGSTLFGVNDPEGNAIVTYSFADAGMGPNTGYFTLDGQRQAENFRIDVPGAQLDRLQWVSGAVSGNDTVWARASDAGGPGEWLSFNLTTQANLRPVVTAQNRTLNAGQTVAASTLFGVSDPENNPIVSYSFADAGMGVNTGYFTLDGTRQAENFRIDVPGAQLSRVQWVAGSQAGTDVAWARASDAGGFGDWQHWNMATTPG